MEEEIVVDMSEEPTVELIETISEIEYDKIDSLRGMNITITTTAKTDAEAKALLAAFKFPFKN